jgi:hypothetical protein
MLIINICSMFIGCFVVPPSWMSRLCHVSILNSRLQAALHNMYSKCTSQMYISDDFIPTEIHVSDVIIKNILQLKVLNIYKKNNFLSKGYTDENMCT